MKQEMNICRKKRSGSGTILLLLFLLFMTAAVGFLGFLVWQKDKEIGEMKQKLALVRRKEASLASDMEELKGTIGELQQEVRKMDTKYAAERTDPAGEFSDPSEKSLSVPSEELSVRLVPGELLDENKVLGAVDQYFRINEISYDGEIFQRINGKSYQENENIRLSDLRYLLMPHYNFDHQIQVGEMIVNAAIAQDVTDVFKELLTGGYEINSMYLVDNYWTGDGLTSDTASIEANNTSCFNYRPSTSSGALSNHALGLAIDLNPQQNPYLWLEGDSYVWYHSNADPYVDRYSGDPHVIVAGDFCYNTFRKYGFSWGGDWSNPIDYQHFEKTVG